MDIRAFVHCKLRYYFEGVSHDFFRGQNILVNYLLIEKDTLRGPSMYPTINTGKSITNSRNSLSNSRRMLRLRREFSSHMSQSVIILAPIEVKRDYNAYLQSSHY